MMTNSTYERAVEALRDLLQHRYAQRVILGAITVGVAAVVVMTGVAFGPAGFGFAAIGAALLGGFVLSRYRFGLRTFLVLVAVAGAWLGMKVERDRKVDTATEFVLASGGDLMVTDRQQNFPWGLYSYRYRIFFGDPRRPIGDEGVEKLLGLAPDRLHSLSMGDMGVTSAGLEEIGKFTELEHLGLGAFSTAASTGSVQYFPNEVTDESLAALAGLTKLRGFGIQRSVVTGEGLVHLSGMRELVSLDLSGTQVRGEGLLQLAELPELLSLRLGGSEVRDEDMKHLAELPALSYLNLDDTQISDAGLADLAESKTLTQISLRGTKVTGIGLGAFVDGCPLRRVDLDRCTISTEGYEALAALTDVSDVSLIRSDVTDEDLERLGAMEGIRSLRIGSNIRLTAAAIQRFEAAHPRCDVRQ